MIVERPANGPAAGVTVRAYYQACSWAAVGVNVGPCGCYWAEVGLLLSWDCHDVGPGSGRAGRCRDGGEEGFQRRVRQWGDRWRSDCGRTKVARGVSK
ncbi:hypothetical protein Droror1_Dr00015533 [Drosera rotundifolia]